MRGRCVLHGILGDHRGKEGVRGGGQIHGRQTVGVGVRVGIRGGVVRRAGAVTHWPTRHAPPPLHDTTPCLASVCAGGDGLHCEALPPFTARDCARCTLLRHVALPRCAQVVIVPIVKKEADRVPVSQAAEKLAEAAKAAGIRVKVGGVCTAGGGGGGRKPTHLHERRCDTLCTQCMPPYPPLPQRSGSGLGWVCVFQCLITDLDNAQTCYTTFPPLPPYSLPLARLTRTSARPPAGSSTTGRCAACPCGWRWGPRMWRRAHAWWRGGTCQVGGVARGSAARAWDDRWIVIARCDMPGGPDTWVVVVSACRLAAPPYLPYRRLGSHRSAPSTATLYFPAGKEAGVYHAIWILRNANTMFLPDLLQARRASSSVCPWRRQPSRGTCRAC